jgi:hypothetical protein
MRQNEEAMALFLSFVYVYFQLYTQLKVFPRISKILDLKLPSGCVNSDRGN